MCLIIHNDHAKVTIAEANIACYKSVLTRRYSFKAHSPVQIYTYYKGKLNKENSLRIQPWGGYGDYSKVERGFHAYIKAGVGTNLFIIPKGSEIVEGCTNCEPVSASEHNTYVSNQIIYVGRNNWFNRLVAELKYGVKFQSNTKSLK